MKIRLFTDGGSRGNPGSGAAGVVIQSFDSGGQELSEHQFGLCLGKVTNNQAEYMALIAGLKAIKKHFETDGLEQIEVMMDSELIVKQMKGEYKVKEPGLGRLFQQVKAEIKAFSMVQFNHIERQKNKTADFLVNQVLDLQKILEYQNGA